MAEIKPPVGADARTLHLLSNRWFSALSDYAITAAAALHSAGSANLLVMPERSAALAVANDRQLDIETVRSFSLLLLPRLLRLIRRFKPTAIICYEGQETTLMLLLKPFISRDIAIFRFYGRDLRLLKFPPQPWLKLSTQHLDGVIVPSKVIAEAVEPQFLGRCHQITMARHLPPHPPRKAADAQPPKLLMLGRLDPVKGHREFVVMFKAMLERWPTGEPLPSLAIRGQPQNVTAQSLGQWLRLYGVAEQVNFDSTKAADLAKLLAAYDAGVIYSQGSEVICRVGAEMLMAGLGIIVTDVGALSELNLRANATDVLVVPSLDTDEQTVTLDAMIAFTRARASEPHEDKLQRQKFYQRAFSYELMAIRLLRLFAAAKISDKKATP